MYGASWNLSKTETFAPRLGKRSTERNQAFKSNVQFKTPIYSNQNAKTTAMVAYPLIAKAGSTWTSADLRFCNANIVDVEINTFFPGLEKLPKPNVSREVLDTEISYPQLHHPLHTHIHLSPASRAFFNCLAATTTPTNSIDQETATINFTAHLLTLLGFTKPPIADINGGQGPPLDAYRALRRNYDLPLFTCGRTVHAVADLCVVQCGSQDPHPDGDRVLLLVKAVQYPTASPPSSDLHVSLVHRDQDADYDDSVSCAEAQLFAQAIAVFQQHSRALRRLRLPSCDTEVIPALLMKGSEPVLYKIEITAGLVECVQSARVPPRVTAVQRLVLPSGRPSLRSVEGMRPLDNRATMLGGVQALKALL